MHQLRKAKESQVRDRLKKKRPSPVISAMMRKKLQVFYFFFNKVPKIIKCVEFPIEKDAPVKKGKGKPSKGSAKKEKAPSKKKSPAAPKKTAATPPATKTMASFFTRKEDASDSKELTETKKSTLVKPDDSSEYNPMASKYHPINDSCWQKGKP